MALAISASMLAGGCLMVAGFIIGYLVREYKYKREQQAA